MRDLRPRASQRESSRRDRRFFLEERSESRRLYFRPPIRNRKMPAQHRRLLSDDRTHKYSEKPPIPPQIPQPLPAMDPHQPLPALHRLNRQFHRDRGRELHFQQPDESCGKPYSLRSRHQQILPDIRSIAASPVSDREFQQEHSVHPPTNAHPKQSPDRGLLFPDFRPKVPANRSGSCKHNASVQL